MTTYDITSLSPSLSSANLLNQVGTAVLDMAMDDEKVLADGMKKMMELSVNPNVGANVDFYA